MRIDYSKPIIDCGKRGYAVIDFETQNSYGIMKDHEKFTEVEAYLADHPEALVPEPVSEPPSKEEIARREEQSLLAYLSSTDWYVARWGETGAEIPAEVKAKRQDARVRISEIRNQ